jgi:hypothetical protein
MATHFNHWRSAIGRIAPDFNLLHVERHTIDPRAATSIIIACMTLALALMVTVTLTQPVRRAPPKSAEQVASPPAAGKVKIVAATPRLDVPCAEQTWPYIDRRCLTETTQKRPMPEGRTREPVATPAPADAQKATPPVASVVSPPAPAETQGTATRETAIKPETEAPPAINDDRDDAELADDADFYPVMSPREWRRLERMERLRAAQERRMRHWQPPFFPRIF